MVILASNSESVKSPVATKFVKPSDNDVSSPVMPDGAFVMSSTFFSSAWCGAWSVAITEMTPDFKPSITAKRSFSVRSGGFILAAEPLIKSKSSVFEKCCGAASAVTFAPKC